MIDIQTISSLSTRQAYGIAALIFLVVPIAMAIVANCSFALISGGNMHYRFCTVQLLCPVLPSKVGANKALHPPQGSLSMSRRLRTQRKSWISASAPLL
jgi:hypothetical protein